MICICLIFIFAIFTNELFIDFILFPLFSFLLEISQTLFWTLVIGEVMEEFPDRLADMSDCWLMYYSVNIQLLVRPCDWKYLEYRIILFSVSFSSQYIIVIGIRQLFQYKIVLSKLQNSSQYNKFLSLIQFPYKGVLSQ